MDKNAAVAALSPEDQAAMQPETFANPMVKALMEGAAKNAAVPGQIMAENPYPPGSEEATWYEGQRQKGGEDWAHRSSLQFMGAGAPFAEPGAAGIFTGRLSRNLDPRAKANAKGYTYGSQVPTSGSNLEMAYDMVNRGEKPADVWRKTNWMFDPANTRWTTEIPDTGMRMMSTGTRGPLEYQVSHPELYAAHPELKSHAFSSSVQPDVSGSYFGMNARHPNSLPDIWVGGPSANAMRDPVAHELQHAVQRLNGWSPGVSIDQMRSAVRAKPEDYTDLRLDPKDPGYDLYRRFVGEVQAWNTGSKRLPMTKGQRLNNPPWETQDVPYKDQLYLNPQTYEAQAVANMPDSKNDAMNRYIRSLMEGK